MKQKCPAGYTPQDCCRINPKAALCLASVRDSLKRVAEHEPAEAQPFIATLTIQLKGWAKGDAADHAALRTEIEKNIKRIEKARSIQTAKRQK